MKNIARRGDKLAPKSLSRENASAKVRVVVAPSFLDDYHAYSNPTSRPHSRRRSEEKK